MVSDTRPLPARPLQAALRRKKRVDSLSWDELAVSLGVCSRTLYRLLKAQHVSYRVADRMTCRMGLHPLLLWPKEWSQ